MAHGLVYRCSLLLACLLGFASAGNAQSADRGAALHWVRLPGAEECAGGDALSRAVETKLRREVFPEPRDASVLIEGYVEPAAGGYRAALQVRSSAGALLGSRELSSQARNCDELSETVAVVLAVMIDPDAAARAQGKSPAEPPREREPTSRRAQRVLGFARISWGLVEVVGAEQSDPKTLRGGGLAYERGLRRWGGLRVEGAWQAADLGRLDLSDGGAMASETKFTLATVGVGYCPLWLATNRLHSAACLGSELGGMRARDANTPISEGTPANVWWSASLQARLALRLLGPLEAHVAGTITYPIAYNEFRNDGLSIRVNDGHVYGSADVGLGVRF